MTNNPTIKKALFVLGVFAMLIFLSILFLFVSTFKKTAPVPKEAVPVTQVDTTTPLAYTVKPLSTQQLIAGQVQVFTITLDPSVDATSVRASVSSSPPSDASAKTLIPTTINVSGQRLEITTKIPTDPYTTYTLTLLYRSRIILQQAYLSTPAVETPIPTNNPTLSSFLPYSTLNYILDFNKEQNIYVMHFKYNPNSSKDLSTQFNDAKTSANNFILGKGIDIKSITINYLFK